MRTEVPNQGEHCPNCGGGLPFDADDTQVCVCDRYAYGALTPMRTSELTGDAWRWIGHLLACRTGDQCEHCGVPNVPGRSELSIHHRRPRGAGGSRRPETNALANLVLLCSGTSRRLAGVLGCHGAIEGAGRGRARAEGWLVPQGVDPATVPLVLFSGRRVLLDPVNPFYLPPVSGPAYAVDSTPRANA